MEPLYKKGDIVTIAKREGLSTDYRFTFTDEMQEFVGQSFEIVGLKQDSGEPCMRKDDGWVSYLSGGATGYCWASSMFEPKKTDEKNLNAALGYIDDEYLRRWLKDVIHAKYDKPAWSEENKKMIERLILSLSRISANTRTDSTSLNYTFYNEINWLKSLKDRYAWRPSDEQMDALHYVTNFDYGGHKATLVSLYEQLKKLK